MRIAFWLKTYNTTDVAFGRIPVPAKHGVDSLGELCIVRLVDA